MKIFIKIFCKETRNLYRINIVNEDIKKDIKFFIEHIKEKYGYIPKFAHNLNPNLEKKVYYSGAYFDDNEIIAAIETLLFGKWSSSGEVCAKFEKEFSKK